ncbi:conserved hypothetical protein [Leishmania major strain Friedlin]|uniref:Polycystin cation channel PKD1/PKD2 domain-containing protein n=1 Tax=Leishmania major TaxID=5664 RepID=Q4Q995_LEIMA|nr:conserved hypothetical protein [Leishmania major strain Friedlin]CAG9576419.1 Ion_transport_protein/Polycystin_cation_channel_-_putative [Leishmania major strain Friedlin]CAJ05035.1 conserved hypothetical protein [Leishmania major strain Friedlin]|eukprot:XP_001684103.1 conserved hypothetical protein [Leishmania major strain Friedlin]
MVLLHSLVNVIILALLLLFAFQYQTIRNKEATDARYTLASYLFASNDHTHSYLYRRIETIDEFVGALESIVRAYYAVPTRSRGLFMHYTNSSSRDFDAIAPPTLFLQYHLGYHGAPSYAQLGTKTYALTLESPTGPFVNTTALLNNASESCTPQADPVAGGAFIPCRVSAIGDLLDRVVLLRLAFSLFARSRRWAGDRAATTPSTWDVVVDYGFEGHKAAVTMTVRLSSVSRRQLEQEPLLLCWAVGLLALVDMCARLRVQVKEMTVVNSRHHHYGTLPGEEEGLGKVQMLSPTLGTVKAGENGWRWMGYLSNVAVLSFATVALVAQHKRCTNASLEEAVTLLLAFAAMLSSFRVVVLLKLFPAWYVLIDGLATSLQQLSVFVVGVLPVLIGYAVCGTAVFGGMSGIYFQSIPSATVTLLCSMFGDNLLSTFLHMDQSPHWLQMLFVRVFILTFLALFVCNILSIAHSIIQDSYSQALKSYASTTTAAAEAAAVAQQQRPSDSNGWIGAYEEMSDDEGGAEHDRRNRPDERTPDSAASTAATLASYSRPEHSPGNSSNARRQAVPPFSPREVLRAADVKRMLSRLERVSL